jgi:hypothetical protein
MDIPLIIITFRGFLWRLLASRGDGTTKFKSLLRSSLSLVLLVEYIFFNALLGGILSGASYLGSPLRLLMVLSNDYLKSWLTLFDVFLVPSGSRKWLAAGLSAIAFIWKASSAEYPTNRLNTEYSSLILTSALNRSNSSTANKLFSNNSMTLRSSTNYYSTSIPCYSFRSDFVKIILEYLSSRCGSGHRCPVSRQNPFKTDL